MAETILPTGTDETYDTHVEALAAIPANVAVGNPYVIQHRVSETVGRLLVAKANANNAPHRWEARADVRHDGRTESGVIVSGGSDNTVVTSNDWIIQDLHFKVTVANRVWITASSASSVRLIVRRCTFANTADTGVGLYLGRTDQSLSFCTIASSGGSQSIVNIGISFCVASVVAASATVTYMFNVSVGGTSKTHACTSLAADGGTTEEWYGTPSVASYNLSEAEVMGTDPIDLTTDLGIAFSDMLNSSDMSDWGFKDSFIALSGIVYGGTVDLTSLYGWEAIDVEGNAFDDTGDIIVCPRQIAEAPPTDESEEMWSGRTAALVSADPTDGIGYATGAGGAATQLTSKATGVTLDCVCGQVTMHAASLAAGASVSFVLTNAAIAASDIVLGMHGSAGTQGAYTVEANHIAAGSVSITVTNITGGALAEAILLHFVVLKAVMN